MSDLMTIGFIGLGVMGGPMCRNVATKHNGRVLAFDLSQTALEELSDTKIEAQDSIESLAENSDVILMSLPGGPQVEAVALIISQYAKSGTTVIDLSTTPISVARSVDAMLCKKSINFVDAPVARTREAAQKGELSIMVGAPIELFKQIEPILYYMATDVTLGGEVGCGQVLKLVNNMLVFANTVALAEMMVLGEKAGVEPTRLLDAVSKGSGDSFVLRNHGMKAMAPRNFPEKSFPPEYVLKDIDYVFQLAKEMDVAIPAAQKAQDYYETAVKQGLGGKYFPGVIELA